MVEYSYYTSGEYSITGGSGSISLAIPLNLAIAAIGFRFKGISIAGTTPTTGTWYSDTAYVTNGSSSGGGVPSGATAAGCAYTGVSSYVDGPPTSGNTGWNDSGQSESGQSVSNSVTVPSLPEGATFSSGTVEYYGYNYDGQARSVYVNGAGPYSVAGSGGYKKVTAALTAGDCGTTKTVNVSGSGYYQRARVQAIVYFTGPGAPIETKTGNCSNNYGGSVGGPLNNGQTVWDSSMSLPSGNFTHSISGSGQAYFQYAVQYTYQQSYEIVTANPSASCNGYSASYSGAISNGNWVLPGTGVSAWIRMNPLAFPAGMTANISVSVGGSQKCGVMIAYAYTRARPTPLDTWKVRKSVSTTVDLPIVATDDVYLDVGSYARICTDGSNPEAPVIRCLDLVEIDDGDASGVRARTHAGTKSVRKKMT